LYVHLTVNTLDSYPFKNGIPRKTKITWRPWTKKDEEYLIKNWPTKNIPAMEEELDRTESAMRSRVHYLKDRIKNPKPVRESKPKPLTMGEKAYNEIIEAQRRYHAKEKEKMGIEV
jgi:hypothetical protein